MPPRDVMRQMRPARTGIADAWGWGVCIRAMGITFDLAQDLDVVSTRPGARPPRLGMVGRVVGTLQVTDPCKCCWAKCKGRGKPCGTAEQGPATAHLSVGETSLLTRAGLTIANAFRDCICAQEGAFGTHLLERDVVSQVRLVDHGHRSYGLHVLEQRSA